MQADRPAHALTHPARASIWTELLGDGGENVESWFPDDLSSEGDTVREVSFADKALQYCPTCQTDGKPLADRRLSRLLK